MAKKETSIVSLFVWVVGLIVALAVGSGMIDKTLKVWFLPEIVTIVAGWIVVVGAILSVVLAIFDK